MNESQEVKKPRDFWIGIVTSLGILIIMYVLLILTSDALIPWFVGGGAILYALYLIIFTKRKMIGVGILAFPVIVSITVGGCFFIVTRK